MRAFLLKFAICAGLLLNSGFAQDLNLKPEPGDRLRMGYVKQNEIAFNPLYQPTEYEREINRFIFGDGLYTVADDGHIIRGLAASVSAQPQRNRIWRVNLRSNIFFHNGELITSEDVKFTFELYKKFALQAPHLFKARLIDEIKIISPKSLQILLVQPLPNFDETLGQLPILSKKLYQQWMLYNNVRELPRITPVGSGYFRYREELPDGTLKLEVNRDHYRRRAYLDGMDFYLFETYDQLIDAFLRENIDMISVQDKSVIQKIYQFTQAREYIIGVDRDDVKLYYINFNTSKFPFDDINIRRAVNYALNKRQYIVKLLENQGRIAGTVLDESSDFYFDATIDYPYSPLRSLSILRSDGFRRRPDGKLFKGGRELKFEFYFAEGSPFEESLVRMISINLSELGINIIPRPLKPVELQKRIKNGNFSAALQSYQYLRVNAAEAMRDFYINHLRGGNGFENFKSNSLDNLIRYTQRSLKSDDMKNAVHRMQYLISQSVPCAFLFFEDRAYYAINNRFENIKNLFYQKLEYVVKFYPKNEWYVPKEKQRF